MAMSVNAPKVAINSSSQNGSFSPLTDATRDGRNQTSKHRYQQLHISASKDISNYRYQQLHIYISTILQTSASTDISNYRYQQLHIYIYQHYITDISKYRHQQVSTDISKYRYQQVQTSADPQAVGGRHNEMKSVHVLSLIHISEPTRPP